MALKPRGDITRSPKRGYQWPHKKDMCLNNSFLKVKGPVHTVFAYTNITVGTFKGCFSECFTDNIVHLEQFPFRYNIKQFK